MKTTLARFALVLIASAVIAASLAGVGCSSSGSKAVKRSEKTVDSLSEFRSQVVAAGAQLDRTMASLDGVIGASGDRKKAFERYMKDVAALKKQGEEAKSRADDLRNRSREYVAKWQQEVSSVSNPELKAQAEARRAMVQDRIDEIEADAAAAKNAYVPLMKNLTDIQTVLSNDLSAAGVQGVAPVAASARQDAAALKRSLDAFVGELDNLIGQIGPKSQG